jgi:predicted O-methyltransferase YrrM
METVSEAGTAISLRSSAQLPSHRSGNSMRESAITLASEISPVELSTLLSVLKSRSLQGKHLEIGTAAGGTLKELIRSYPAEKRPHFVVVDPMSYFPNQLTTVRQNLSSAGIDPESIEFRVGKSWPMFQAAERAGEHFSFIFVDGSHKIHHVTEDLAWTRLLEPGGIVCFHDYAPKFPGLMGAVDRFLERYPAYKILTQTESLLVVQKTGKSKRREISLWDRMRARIINITHQLRASIEKRIERKRRSAV